MKKYAILDSDGFVSNVILAATLQIAEQVTGSEAIHLPIGSMVNIGDLYSNGQFSTPAQEE